MSRKINTNSVNLSRTKIGPAGNSPEGRRVLLGLGYEPIPICGKAPKWRGWSSGEITPDRLAEVEAAHPDHESTGLRTGHLVAVDVDVIDPARSLEVQQAIEAHLGPTDYYRIGRKGAALLYYNPDPIRKLVVQGIAPEGGSEKVEILGTGQQLAAFGDHPDTGKPYTWPESSPFDCRCKDLPKTDPDALRTLLPILARVFGNLGYKDVKVDGTADKVANAASASKGEPVTVAMLEDMLAHIDPGCDRRTWIAVAGGLSAAEVIGPGAEDLDRAVLFDRWSAGELNPDHDPGNYTGDAADNYETMSPTKPGGAGVGSLVTLAGAKLNPWKGSPFVSAIERLRLKGQGYEIPEPPVGDWFQPVADLNERFAIVTGGKHAGRIADLSNPREPLFLDPTRFHSMHREHQVTNPNKEPPKPAPVSKLWECWSDRRKITGVDCVPPPSADRLPEGVHNLWQGYAVEPTEGNEHRPLLEHLRTNVCGGDESLFKWLLAWLADLVQRPGDKPGVAVALRGRQGAGKSVLYRYLEAILGGHAASVDHPSLVVGNFNAHMAGLVLLGVEEGFWAGSKEAESRLKNLITADQIMLEQKGVDAIKIHSHVHVLVTSNARWVVPVAADDRRWAVFEVNDQHRNDRAYWTPIYDALNEDGPSNLLHYLLGFRYDPAVLFRPPMTAAKAHQAEASMDSTDSWLLEVLRGDRDPTAPVVGKARPVEDEDRPDGIFAALTVKDQVYRDYVDWCDNHRRRQPPHLANHFWRRLREVFGPDLSEQRKRDGGDRTRYVWLSDRDICQQQFASAYGCEWSALEG